MRTQKNIINEKLKMTTLLGEIVLKPSAKEMKNRFIKILEGIVPCSGSCNGGCSHRGRSLKADFFNS